jgi:hypothetical protein
LDRKIAVETAMTETLIVVGNAEPQEDWSEFIDQCAVVIRFNFTPFFDTLRTGLNTTILCLAGVPYPRAGEIPQLNAGIVKSCQTIWVETPAFFDPLLRGYKIPPQRITLMNLHAVHDNYAAQDAEPIQKPSSGFQVLRYLVNSAAFAGHQKFICGFEWRGGSGHPWDQEKRQVARYLKLGLVSSL